MVVCQPAFHLQQVCHGLGSAHELAVHKGLENGTGEGAIHEGDGLKKH